MERSGDEAMVQPGTDPKDTAIDAVSAEEQLGDIVRQLADLADQARLLSLEPLEGQSSPDE